MEFMTKEKFLETISTLVRLQTYQCYKGKAYKKDIRKQYKCIKLLASVLNVSSLTNVEILELFQKMNCWDVDLKLVIEALKLQS